MGIVCQFTWGTNIAESCRYTQFDTLRILCDRLVASKKAHVACDNAGCIETDPLHWCLDSGEFYQASFWREIPQFSVKGVALVQPFNEARPVQRSTALPNVANLNLGPNIQRLYSDVNRDRIEKTSGKALVVSWVGYRWHPGQLPTEPPVNSPRLPQDLRDS